MGADCLEQRASRPDRLASAGIRSRLQVAGPSALLEQPVVAPPAVRRLAVNFVQPCLAKQPVAARRPSMLSNETHIHVALCLSPRAKEKDDWAKHCLKFRIFPVLASHRFVDLTEVSHVPAMCRADDKKSMFDRSYFPASKQGTGREKENMTRESPVGTRSEGDPALGTLENCSCRPYVCLLEACGKSAARWTVSWL